MYDSALCTRAHATIMDRRVALAVVAAGGIARSLGADANATSASVLGSLAAADERLVMRTATTVFTDALGEATLLVVALLFVAFFAYVAPRIADFFLATCRVPRHVRFQLTLLLRIVLVAGGVYYAFVLVGIDLMTIVVVGSVVSIIAADSLRPLTTALVAGFWLQSTPRFEPGRRVRAGAYYGTIIALGAFSVTLRLMPSSSAALEARGADETQSARTSGDEPDAGVDEYGVPYADKTLDVPNADLLVEAVTTYWAAPQTSVDERYHAQRAAAAAAPAWRAPVRFAPAAAASTLRARKTPGV